ncbi:hypothetical protein GCM10027055_14980 [Janibacter alkaliphilus]|uniref:Putative DCC family thiol-disulfide oxidoreductase YuxK n=1 Tax=Janibacter alkaliphilus TaxID=1069963 RepID=A0A852XGG9_9MICO|nr:DUF393 domain-containing protein [Janibacter alkaliphilus]NYG37511.1 putative DCC family thiol-disulfide oxidoreductase YuxK [Janibacter alkaliphilus]
MRRPVLVFDGDCGMCTRAASLVERRFRPEPERFDVAPSQALDLDALGLTQAECDEALQWVATDGSIASGHAAVARMLRASYPWARPLGALLTAPVLDRVAALAYRWVARNRHIFPGGTPACAVPGSTTDPAGPTATDAQGERP